MKRKVAILLTVCLLIGVIPLTTWAETDIPVEKVLTETEKKEETDTLTEEGPIQVVVSAKGEGTITFDRATLSSAEEPDVSGMKYTFASPCNSLKMTMTPGEDCNLAFLKVEQTEKEYDLGKVDEYPELTKSDGIFTLDLNMMNAAFFVKESGKQFAFIEVAFFPNFGPDEESPILVEILTVGDGNVQFTPGFSHWRQFPDTKQYTFASPCELIQAELIPAEGQKLEYIRVEQDGDPEKTGMNLDSDSRLSKKNEHTVLNLDLSKTQYNDGDSFKRIFVEIRFGDGTPEPEPQKSNVERVLGELGSYVFAYGKQKDMEWDESLQRAMAEELTQKRIGCDVSLGEALGTVARGCRTSD